MSEMASFPFRLRARALSEAALRAFNRSPRMRGEPPFSSGAAALRVLQRTDSLDEAERRRLATHPDERVPIALLQSGRVREQELEIRNLLFLRAVDGEPDLLWTPLLDALAASGLWPDRSLQVRFYAEAVRPPLRSEWGMSSRLNHWLMLEGKGEALRSLAHFRSRTFRSAVAARARELDADVLNEFCSDPRTWPYLRSNPQLGVREEAQAWLVERAVKVLLPGSAMCDFDAAADTLAHLRQWGYSLSPLARERMMAAVWNHLEGGPAWGAPSASVLALAGERELPAKWVEALVRYVLKGPSPERNQQLAAALVKSPALDGATRTRLLAWERGGIPHEPYKVAQEVAWQKQALEDASLFRRLLRTPDETVLQRLAAQSAGERFRRVFQRAVRWNLRLAGDILSSATEQQLHALRRTDLAPLLASEDAGMRLRAIRESGRLPVETPCSAARGGGDEGAALAPPLRATGRMGKDSLLLWFPRSVASPTMRDDLARARAVWMQRFFRFEPVAWVDFGAPGQMDEAGMQALAEMARGLLAGSVWEQGKLVQLAELALRVQAEGWEVDGATLALLSERLVEVREGVRQARFSPLPLYLWLARAGNTPVEGLHSLVASLRHQGEQRSVLLELASHSPVAEESLYVRLAEEFGFIRGLRAALSANPRAREIPRVRAVLEKSRDPEVLLQLALAAGEADFASRVARLQALDHVAVQLRLLEEMSARQRAWLPRDFLLPFLGHASPEIRLLAIRCLRSSAPEEEQRVTEGPSPRRRA